jgi:hypothetical protein
MPRCQPVLTQPWVIAIFAFVGVLFTPIGIAVVYESSAVRELWPARTRV